MKVQRNITIDAEINEKLKGSPHINASGLINDLLKAYFNEEEEKVDFIEEGIDMLKVGSEHEFELGGIKEEGERG